MRRLIRQSINERGLRVRFSYPGPRSHTWPHKTDYGKTGRSTRNGGQIRRASPCGQSVGGSVVAGRAGATSAGWENGFRAPESAAVLLRPSRCAFDVSAIASRRATAGHPGVQLFARCMVAAVTAPRTAGKRAIQRIVWSNPGMQVAWNACSQATERGVRSPGRAGQAGVRLFGSVAVVAGPNRAVFDLDRKFPDRLVGRRA